MADVFVTVVCLLIPEVDTTIRQVADQGVDMALVGVSYEDPVLHADGARPRLGVRFVLLAKIWR
ncbi:MAG: hypothetical protein ACOCWU_02565 [Spirochaetota bacterium]